MEVPLTTGMTGAIVEVMVEVLCVLAIATKEIKQNRASELTHFDRPTLSAYCNAYRNVSEEVGGKEGHGECAAEARKCDTGGNSNDECGSL